jgi:hypothetical protein
LNSKRIQKLGERISSYPVVGLSTSEPTHARRYFNATRRTALSWIRPGTLQAIPQGNRFSRRRFHAYDAVCGACRDAWNWLAKQIRRAAAVGSRT